MRNFAGVDQQSIISIFAQLGKLFKALSVSGYSRESAVTESEFERLKSVVRKEHIYNPWFTAQNIDAQLSALGQMLELSKLSAFAASYSFASRPKRIGIVMAGNLPLVGFHDLLCTVLSGNIAVCKLSSQDKNLLPAFLSVVNEWNPQISERIVLSPGPLQHIDAVIATGSNNSVGYFEQYFGRYPHVFRKNRTSVAVLDGTETEEELKLLGKDIFSFFGMGCRNVSHLLIPSAYSLDHLFGAIVEEGDIVNHHKYANNYDYNRTVLLMNQLPFLDNNFVLLREDESLFSPLSVVHYQRYDSPQEVNAYLRDHADEIQVIVGHGRTAFGESQHPELSDFSDNVDIMAFLERLNA